MNEPETWISFGMTFNTRLPGKGSRRPLDPLTPRLGSMSVLEKAVRRGLEESAIGAAATLLRDAPNNFWRRIGSIAYQDVGVASLEEWALRRRRWRGSKLAPSWRRMGGRCLCGRRTLPGAEVTGS